MEVAVKYDVRETHINTTTQEYIHGLLQDGHEDNEHRIPDPENTPRATGETDLTVYKVV